MTSLTSQQRKLVYLCGILILLIPIISLGLPASGKDSPGGTLTRLRTKYELGESDLGKVDPSGAAMNLVLLGMRGVAVNLLYTQFEKERDAKQWEEMRATTESIVRLQPHFEKVWEMNGWNLAYNTSAEWDAVEDRYYYVKVGGLFMKRGVEQNRKSTHLQYHVANVYQKKIGNADEAKYYRNYFLHDPDPKFKNGPDPDFNPDIMDNYLVAKKEYIRACQIEDTEHRPQHILDRTLFRSMPARCQFDYAQVLQKDGKFGEVTREAWHEALSDWTTKYGQEVFSIPIGDLNNPVKFDIRLGMSRDDIKKEVANPDDVVRVTDMVDRYRKMVNYYYWTTRGNCESEQTTAEAHRNLYEASQKYKSQELDKALELAFAGMTGFDTILHKPEYNELKSEDTLVEECLLGIRVWKGIQELGQLKIPNDYPLKWLEAEHQANVQLQQNVERAYKRAFLSN
ncbi:MAG: hypothetical protein JWP89_984 [Schlesneria sp.]|nr:hypothetical protein [Schlesneria sp.]